LEYVSEFMGNRRTKRFVLRAFADPFFPYTFLMRNVSTLSTEVAWKRLPYRSRKALLKKLLLERSLFFLEVRKRLPKELRPKQTECLALDDLDHPGASYCTDCGVCCEIASGLADFPAAAEIPLRWKTIFGNGLGKGHRFCPFLFEVTKSGRSFCAIHQWRPLPCRAFEEDECEFLKQDASVATPVKSRSSSRAGRWLVKQATSSG
jgi:hypothetical protein